MNILDDVFLRFFNEFKNVAVKIVPVNNRGAVRCGECGATQLHRSFLGKKLASFCFKKRAFLRFYVQLLATKRIDAQKPAE